MLQAQNLAARRGDALLFSGLELSVAPGTALVIGGPNGSGKTTLLRILAGLTQPAEGALVWQNQRMRAFDGSLRAQALFIGHVPALKDELTALENLASLIRLHGAAASEQALRLALDAWAIGRHIASTTGVSGRSSGTESFFALPSGPISRGRRG